MDMMETIELKDIESQVKQVFRELLEAARLKPGQLLVVGCSSSEIEAHRIGSYSSEEVGRAVFAVIYGELKSRGIYLAAQCCEHLDRALIGSFATAAFAGFENPVAVERIQAHAGIDIGDTLIGMHLRPVAVPLSSRRRREAPEAPEPSAPLSC